MADSGAGTPLFKIAAAAAQRVFAFFRWPQLRLKLAPYVTYISLIIIKKMINQNIINYEIIFSFVNLYVCLSLIFFIDTFVFC